MGAWLTRLNSNKACVIQIDGDDKESIKSCSIKQYSLIFKPYAFAGYEYLDYGRGTAVPKKTPFSMNDYVSKDGRHKELYYFADDVHDLIPITDGFDIGKYVEFEFKKPQNIQDLTEALNAFK